MEVVTRPAVRVICLDASARVLLLKWQSPSDGELLWEPPGGGIEPGETPEQAARRELLEETGLDPSLIGLSTVVVDRDTVWNSKRFIGPEPFFVARLNRDGPVLVTTGMLADEHPNLRGYAWLTRAEVTALPERVEPPSLVAVISALAPDAVEWST